MIPKYISYWIKRLQTGLVPAFLSALAAGCVYAPAPDLTDALLADLLVGDGGDATTQIQSGVVAGGNHSCVLRPDGTVRCWGDSGAGQLGYGTTTIIGDDETPASAGNVDVGGTVTALAAGDSHTCAILAGGLVRCWGSGLAGRLGYGNTNAIGDDETPASAGDVDLGGTATAIAAGSAHTCALLSTGSVRCWGDSGAGPLGYANTNDIGDDESPASAGDVNVGGTVTAITAGRFHTCALLTGGTVRCWGAGIYGKLGYANANSIGDDETPASAGDVTVGGTVTAVTGGEFHTCALLASGAVRCWGRAIRGQLGYGNTNNIGDDETPASAGDINLGGTATAISAGDEHNCALLSTGAPRCWGRGLIGRLGYGNTNQIGDNETPSSAGDVSVGGSVTAIASGGLHTCAMLSGEVIRCWGDGSQGALGYANTNHIGDDETPASAGDVTYQ